MSRGKGCIREPNFGAVVEHQLRIMNGGDLPTRLVALSLHCKSIMQLTPSGMDDGANNLSPCFLFSSSLLCEWVEIGGGGTHKFRSLRNTIDMRVMGAGEERLATLITNFQFWTAKTYLM